MFLYKGFNLPRAVTVVMVMVVLNWDINWISISQAMVRKISVEMLVWTNILSDPTKI